MSSDSTQLATQHLLNLGPEPAPVRGDGRLARWRWMLWDEEASASVEYALLLSMITIASLGAWVGLGTSVKATMVALTSALGGPLQ